MGFWVLAMMISIPGGFGLAKLLMTIILEKSNVVGNSLSETEMISSPVSLYDKQDKLEKWGRYHENYTRHYMSALKTIPEYEEAKERGLDVDRAACDHGYSLVDGHAYISDQAIEPIVEMKIEPVSEQGPDASDQKTDASALQAENSAGTAAKRSWQEAVEDPFDELDKFDPGNSDWHK